MDQLLVSYHSEASIHPREVSGGSLTQAMTRVGPLSLWDGVTMGDQCPRCCVLLGPWSLEQGGRLHFDVKVNKAFGYHDASITNVYKCIISFHSMTFSVYIYIYICMYGI